MAVLSYAADALWVVALAIMASASRGAARRIGPRTAVPVLGAGSLRLPRDLALWLVPGLSLALSLVLLWAHRTFALDAAGVVMLFGLRATLAAVAALAHLVWLSRALAVLAAEGALKP